MTPADTDERVLRVLIDGEQNLIVELRKSDEPISSRLRDEQIARFCHV